jgi:hypothetical protein
METMMTDKKPREAEKPARERVRKPGPREALGTIGGRAAGLTPADEQRTPGPNDETKRTGSPGADEDRGQSEDSER